MRSPGKFRGVAWALAHTGLAILAVFIAGFTAYLLRVLVNAERYRRFSRSNTAIAFLLVAVAASGAIVYLRRRDRYAFFAWVLPAVFSLYYAISEWIAGWHQPARKELAVDVLVVCAAYSAGAAISAFVLRRTHADTQPTVQPASKNHTTA